jgi:hypothetical protein
LKRTRIEQVNPVAGKVPGSASRKEVLDGLRQCLPEKCPAPEKCLAPSRAFLFGVPKSNPDPGAGGEAAGSEPPYVPNTNLETISDWLTKVIVGVGLVEIREVVEWLEGIGRTAGAAMGDGETLRVVATALLIHNLLMGFFQGFLVAYLYLPKVFSASQISTPRQRPSATNVPDDE